MHRLESVKCATVLFSVVSVLIPSAIALGQPCEPGSYSGDGNEPCTACPAGTCSDVYGATSCAPCTPGSYSEEGAASCTLWSPGTYADVECLASCTDCPVDTYQPDAGATQCLECPPGMIQPNPGQAGCILDPDFPTVSAWGMVAITLPSLAAGTLVLRRPHAARA